MTSSYAREVAYSDIARQFHFALLIGHTELILIGTFAVYLRLLIDAHFYAFTALSEAQSNGLLLSTVTDLFYRKKFVLPVLIYCIQLDVVLASSALHYFLLVLQFRC